MKIPHNTFKEAIKAGRTQLGLWLISTSPYLAEIAATSGYDWLLIDGEHGPNDVPTILAQLQAVAPYRSHAIVRTVNHDPALIKQILDCGAQTLLIPMVDTAQQARDLVAAMRYPRAGVRGLRGVAPISARASRWGRIADYTDRVEEELCLLVQIESQRGLDNLDEITQVEGVDGVFIGPADLSASMGHLDNPGHPDVKTAIEQAIRRICQLGKAAGIISVDPALAKLHISCGASFVAIAVDTMLFTKAIDEAWQRTQAELAR